MFTKTIKALALGALVATSTACTGSIAGAGGASDTNQVQASNTSTELNVGAFNYSMTSITVDGDHNDVAAGAGATNKGDLGNSADQHASAELETSSDSSADTSFSIDDSENVGGAAIGPIGIEATGG